MSFSQRELVNTYSSRPSVTPHLKRTKALVPPCRPPQLLTPLRTLRRPTLCHHAAQPSHTSLLRLPESSPAKCQHQCTYRHRAGGDTNNRKRPCPQRSAKSQYSYSPCRKRTIILEELTGSSGGSGYPLPSPRITLPFLESLAIVIDLSSSPQPYPSSTLPA